MGVYEERAPPTTGMHWVSVIPVSALPIGRSAPAGTPRRGGSSLFRLRICDSIFVNIFLLIEFKMVNLVLLAFLRVLRNELLRACSLIDNFNQSQYQDSLFCVTARGHF